MNRTQIEWVKNPDGTQGYTHNPISGCKYHTPEGLCLGGGFPCYAFKLANGRLKQRYLSETNVAVAKGDLETFRRAMKDPFYPRFWPERLKDIEIGYHYTDRFGGCEFAAKPRGIFVCNMGELFGDWIPREWQDQIFKTINHYNNKNDRFYLLTKQPQNLSQFSPFPENCWVGVTATNDAMFRIACIALAKVNAKVKYISFEPLLDWSAYFGPPLDKTNSLGDNWMKKAGINWVIIGAQTKPYKPPKIEWVQEIVQACDKAGVKVFLKDNLRPLFVDALAKKLIDRKQFFVHSIGHGGDLRQEMPVGGKL